MAPEIDELKEIVAEDPEDPLVRYSLGSELLRARRAGEIREFREAIRLKPDYTAAFRGLGQALDDNGASVEAIDVFQQGIQVAEETGDLQTGKEMRVFLKRVERKR